MKKLLLSLLCLSGFMVASADTATWVPADNGYENGQEITSVAVNDVITLTFDKGTNNNTPKYYTTGSAVRMYGGNTLTITSSAGNLSKVEITTGTGSYVLNSESSVNQGALTINGGSATWVGDVPEFILTQGGTTGHARITKIVVTYEGEGLSVGAPTFNPAAGQVAPGAKVSISCATEGASIYYTLDGSEPTTASTLYAEPIVINEPVTIKAVAAKEGVLSEVKEASYTLLNVVDNIAAFKATSGKCALKLTDAVVIGRASNGNTYIQDATGGICLYQNVPDTYVVGTVLNGTVVGNYSPFNNLPQLAGGEYDAVVATAGEAPVGREMLIDEITEADYCTLVTFKNAHCEALAANATITQDGSDGEIALYTTFMNTFPEYQNFDITGVIVVYKTTVEISPRTAADFVENAGTKTTIITVDTEKSVFVGSKVALGATVNSEATLTYASSDEAVATVDAEGVVTGVAVGTATITVTAPAFNDYPEATAEVTINVEAAPEGAWRVLVATGTDGTSYAVSVASGSVNKSLAAVEVTVTDGKVVFRDNVDNNLLWEYEAMSPQTEMAYLKSYTGKYVKVSKADVTLIDTTEGAAEWGEDTTNGYWVNDTRALVLRADSYFKNYVATNAGTDDYGTAAAPFEYTVVTTGIEGIEADANTEAVYYNLQGVRVANPACGIYIVKRGNTVSKILVK